MENKLSKGAGLRIKSPQPLLPPPPVKQADSASALHKRPAHCSDFGSAVPVAAGSVGPVSDQCRTMLLGPGVRGFEGTEGCALAIGHAGDHRAAADVVNIPLTAEAARPERGGSGAKPPSPSDGRLLATALPARGVAAAVSVGRCACGALRADHLTERPLAALPDGSGGYCILRKNPRTQAIPGVLPLRQVRL